MRPAGVPAAEAGTAPVVLGLAAGEGLAVLRPVSTVDVAAVALRSWIASGRLRPGERIKETSAALELQLSRGPVREALRILAEDGLVLLSPNHGATVKTVTVADLTEIYSVRLVMGNLALRQMGRGGLDLTDAERTLRSLGAAVRGRKPVDAVDADLLFQDALVRASGLPRTTKIFERTTLQLRAHLGAIDYDYRPVLRSVYEEDEKILTAVRGRRPVEARTAWQAKAERWVRDFVASIDEDFDSSTWLAIAADR